MTLGIHVYFQDTIFQFVVKESELIEVATGLLNDYTEQHPGDFCKAIELE
jgi:hypothetical protein